MTSLLANFDIENIRNFWEIYPNWKTPKVLRDFYIKDKSKNKNKSSLIMWSIIHMFEKSPENPWRNMDSLDKIELINEDILNTPNFDWTKYEDIISSCKNMMLTEDEKSLIEMEEYIERRRLFIKEQQENLSFEVIKTIDETIKRQADLSKEMSRLRDKIMLVEDSGTAKGGKTESAGELGLL